LRQKSTEKENLEMRIKQQEETIQKLRAHISSRKGEIRTLEAKLQNVPSVTKLKFGNVGKGSSTSGSDVEQLRGEIDRQQSLVEQYRSELARRDKADEKQLKVAQWNEKKIFQAKVKTLEEKVDELSKQNANLAAENERVKTLLTKLQNVRYRKSPSSVGKSDQGTKSDHAAAPNRMTEAERGAMNRELQKIRAENARLRQINQDLSGSRPAQSTLTELQSTNVRLKDENSRLKKTCLLGENTAEIEKTNRDLKNKLKETSEHAAYREKRLLAKISEMEKRPMSSDSVNSFVENEALIEMRDNYEKTMERMVFLEEHLKTIGAQVPPDEFWDRK